MAAGKPGPLEVPAVAAGGDDEDDGDAAAAAAAAAAAPPVAPQAPASPGGHALSAAAVKHRKHLQRVAVGSHIEHQRLTVSLPEEGRLRAAKKEDFKKFRDDKKRFHVTREVFTMLNQSAAELDRAQKDFGKGKLVDGRSSEHAQINQTGRVRHQRALAAAAPQEGAEQQQGPSLAVASAEAGSSDGAAPPPAQGKQAAAAAARGSYGPNRWGNFKLLGRLRAGPAAQQQAAPGEGPACARAGNGGAPAASASGAAARDAAASEPGADEAFDDSLESSREGWRTLWVRQRDKRRGTRQQRLDAAASMIQATWLLRRHQRELRKAAARAAAEAAARQAEAAALAAEAAGGAAAADGADWVAVEAGIGGAAAVTSDSGAGSVCGEGDEEWLGEPFADGPASSPQSSEGRCSAEEGAGSGTSRPCSQGEGGREGQQARVPPLPLPSAPPEAGAAGGQLGGAASSRGAAQQASARRGGGGRQQAGEAVRVEQINWGATDVAVAGRRHRGKRRGPSTAAAAQPGATAATAARLLPLDAAPGPRGPLALAEPGAVDVLLAQGRGHGLQQLQPPPPRAPHHVAPGSSAPTSSRRPGERDRAQPGPAPTSTEPLEAGAAAAALQQGGQEQQPASPGARRLLIWRSRGGSGALDASDDEAGGAPTGASPPRSPIAALAERGAELLRSFGSFVRDRVGSLGGGRAGGGTGRGQARSNDGAAAADREPGGGSAGGGETTLAAAKAWSEALPAGALQAGAGAQAVPPGEAAAVAPQPPGGAAAGAAAGDMMISTGLTGTAVSAHAGHGSAATVARRSPSPRYSVEVAPAPVHAASDLSGPKYVPTPLAAGLMGSAAPGKLAPQPPSAAKPQSPAARRRTGAALAALAQQPQVGGGPELQCTQQQQQQQQLSVDSVLAAALQRPRAAWAAPAPPPQLRMPQAAGAAATAAVPPTEQALGSAIAMEACSARSDESLVIWQQQEQTKEGLPQHQAAAAARPAPLPRRGLARGRVALGAAAEGGAPLGISAAGLPATQQALPGGAGAGAGPSPVPAPPQPPALAASQAPATTGGEVMVLIVGAGALPGPKASPTAPGTGRACSALHPLPATRRWTGTAPEPPLGPAGGAGTAAPAAFGVRRVAAAYPSRPAASAAPSSGSRSRGDDSPPEGSAASSARRVTDTAMARQQWLAQQQSGATPGGLGVGGAGLGARAAAPGATEARRQAAIGADEAPLPPAEPGFGLGYLVHWRRSREAVGAGDAAPAPSAESQPQQQAAASRRRTAPVLPGAAMDPEAAGGTGARGPFVGGLARGGAAGRPESRSGGGRGYLKRGTVTPFAQAASVLPVGAPGALRIGGAIAQTAAQPGTSEAARAPNAVAAPGAAAAAAAAGKAALMGASLLQQQPHRGHMRPPARPSPSPPLAVGSAAAGGQQQNGGQDWARSRSEELRLPAIVGHR